MVVNRDEGFHDFYQEIFEFMQTNGLIKIFEGNPGGFTRFINMVLGLSIVEKVSAVDVMEAAINAGLHVQSITEGQTDA